LTLKSIGTTVTVSWDDVSNSSRYTLYFTDAASFKKETASKIQGAVSPYEVKNLLYGKTYSFTVSAENGNGESALSDIKKITLVSPINGTWYGTSETMVGIYFDLEMALTTNTNNADAVSGTSKITMYYNSVPTSITPTVNGTFIGNVLEVTFSNGAIYSGTYGVTSSNISGNIIFSSIPYKLDLKKKN